MLGNQLRAGPPPWHNGALRFRLRLWRQPPRPARGSQGGNCLRKAYFENGRYSGDLDFSCPTGLPNAWLAEELNGICAQVSERAVSSLIWTERRCRTSASWDGGKKLSEAKVFFRDFYGKRRTCT